MHCTHPALPPSLSVLRPLSVPPVSLAPTLRPPSAAAAASMPRRAAVGAHTRVALLDLLAPSRCRTHQSTCVNVAAAAASLPPPLSCCCACLRCSFSFLRLRLDVLLGV
eukprot:scaffold82574_cov74-Cyclotella_meneghiniana.AAC.1